MADQSNIQSAASKSIRPFKSSEEYLYAMKEDLAEWLNALYDQDITMDTFMEGLETGCTLCRHANNVNRAARDFQAQHPEAARSMRMPSREVVFQSRNVIPGSFLARDNVSNFISWCRQELWVKDVLMFETNDLVERCNEKNFVLCLLEVARRGAKFGMLAPMLIQLEEEIEEEIRDQENLEESLGEPGTVGKAPGRGKDVVDAAVGLVASWQEQKRVLCDMRNLDELVREILGHCSCPSQFPMKKVSEGKYKVGDSSTLIFIRVLRTHVMVRVGGGWDTLEHYLDKHDPCRCNAFAHRYQQAKASGQAPHSKSSSAHSSRSTSPGPYWRGDNIAPYKTTERRSLEPSAAPASSTSSSSTRPGRVQHGSLPGDGELNAGRMAASLLPRPPRDRSEPRHFNPLRNKESLLPLTRRLSGDSDSSTASSKGGSGSGAGVGGGRPSLGSRRPNGEEVVLMVNRKEGKHVVERPDGGAQIPSLRPPQTRARSASRERPVPPPSCASPLKPSPPQGPAEGPRAARPERGRSMGLDGPRRLQVPRSLSQGKTPLRGRASEAGPASPRHRDSQVPAADRREDPRPKQAPPGSPRLSGGFSRRQTPSSASSSPIKGAPSSSPARKSGVTPRPPAPRSPSVGSRRLLPPVSQPGRRSPHSSPRLAHHHHPPRSPRATHSPRAVGKLQRGRGQGHPQQLAQDSEEEKGFGFGFQSLPSLDPQREMDLYRSFEAEFLANTQQQTHVAQSRACTAKETPALQLPVSQQNFGALGMHAPGDPNVTDSAYSSSNSSSSSLNVGGRVGALPDLRELKRTSARTCALEDPPTLLHNQTRAGLPNGVLRERERWSAPTGGLRKLPAISSSMEEGEPVRESDPGPPCDVVPSAHVPRQVNGCRGGLPPTEVPMDAQQNNRDWPDVPLDEQQPNLPYDHEDTNANEDLPLPETFPSPLPPPLDDCSYNDSSSESSSMCLSLSEPLSEGSSTPPPPLANGDTEGKVVLRPKKGQKKAERVPSIYKLKLRPRIRPRTDNRPENGPSRIPTPVSYGDLHRRQQSPANLSPLQTPPQSPRPHGPSRKVLHQAFADLIHPQQRSSGMGSRERSFSSEASLDAEPWM